MLKKLIPDDTLILPAHNEPFLGVKTRMQALIDDHEDGLAKLLEMCATPKRAVDVFPALFRTKITTGNYGMATGESLAHLNCLIARKKLTRTRDAEGIDWYKAT
jgi:glyoxylase-like metal-dependent hydrolase (beta-lactamase superfamily II)